MKKLFYRIRITSMQSGLSDDCYLEDTSVKAWAMSRARAMKKLHKNIPNKKVRLIEITEKTVPIR